MRKRKTERNGRKAVVAMPVIIAAVALAFCGCVRETPPPLPKMVTIAFQEFVGYGPFYLGQEKGLFKEEGVDLIFVNEQFDPSRNDAFKAGMLDCDATTLDVLVSKRAGAVPVVAVMEIDRSNGADGIAAVAEVRSLEDLPGKRVAFARDDTGETFLSVILAERKIPFDGLIVVSKEPEEVAQAFLNGEADAAVTWEPELSAVLKRPGSHLLVTSRDAQGIIVDMLNVREDIVKERPELVKALMRGWFKSVAYYRAHPIEASGVIAKYYHMTPSEYRQAVQGLAWTPYESQTAPDAYASLMRTFGTVADLKLSNRRIAQKPKASEAIDRSLLAGLYEDSH